MTPRDRLFLLEQFGIKLGLDNITTLVDALGRPDRSFPSVHVAGTNGKGSVSAMVERGLRAAGHRTGRYTSPHLVAIEERIAIDGMAIAGSLFDTVTAEVLALVDRLRAAGTLSHAPTFFETTTAIAFEVFRRAEVSAAVVEVGLGGRFDATNVIAPALCAITSIAFDHERHLGNSLAQIASEKAGIIKAGVPVVVGRMPDEAIAVIDEVARAINAPVVHATPADDGEAVNLALPGAHQRDNAAVAVEMLRVWRDVRGDIKREHILSALTDVEWPARLEWLRVPALGDVLLDAAHNPAGATALADYVLATVGPMPIVLAAMKDKDVDRIVRALAPAVSRFVATAADSPRTLTPRELATRIATVAPTIPCHWCDDAGAALREACQQGRAMVAGSIFLVGPLRAQLLAWGAVAVRYPAGASSFYLR
jgi:dihydrofolate synthase / folylpolyglutamate synthase